MVGVPKSTGCFICRKRKIKCDETWPTCLNCQKNGKVLLCPGPPARHTFRNLGPKFKSGTTTTSETSEESTPALLDQRSKCLTQLNEKFAENGSVQHKFRISHKDPRPQRRPERRTSSSSKSPPKSPFLRQPSPSQHQELARALVTATNTGTTGQQMSVFGTFIREVPKRIGHNAALDAAVAVLVNAHTSLIHKKMANAIVSPELYLRAIKTLQICLEDPQQGMSANTLCASIILGLVEALAGPRVGNRYLAHVGGAGRLMELRGPKKYDDPFTKEILRFNRGGIIVTSIYERRSCFLVAPEWRHIAFDKTGLSPDEALHNDVLECMADLPGIFHDSKALNNQVSMPPVDITGYNVDVDIDINININSNIGESTAEDLANTCSTLDFAPEKFDGDLSFLNDLQPVEALYSIDATVCPQPDAQMSLLYKVQTLKDRLTALGTQLNAKLTDGATVFEIPAMEEDNPIATAYHFKNWRDMTAYNCFWSMQILTNKVLMRHLAPYDPTIYDLQSECRAVALQICKTWENAWATKPIGAFHTGLSFVVAYEFCTPDVKEWIIRGLNSLLDYQMVDAFRWSDDVITMMSSKLAGEGPDIVFSNVSVAKEER